MALLDPSISSALWVSVIIVVLSVIYTFWKDKAPAAKPKVESGDEPKIGGK